MTTIGYKELIKLLDQADFLLGLWPEPGARPRNGETWESAGFQLTVGIKVTIKARGQRIGERTEYHRIQFGKIAATPPATRMHASYGTAVALCVLLKHEIKRCASRTGSVNGGNPVFKIEPATWSAGARPATFQVAAGDGHEAWGGNVYSVTIGDMYLYLADATCEPANRWGAIDWADPAKAAKDTHDCATYFYNFDPGADRPALVAEGSDAVP